MGAHFADVEAGSKQDMPGRHGSGGVHRHSFTPQMLHLSRKFIRKIERKIGKEEKGKREGRESRCVVPYGEEGGKGGREGGGEGFSLKMRLLYQDAGRHQGEGQDINSYHQYFSILTSPGLSMLPDSN